MIASLIEVHYSIKYLHHLISDTLHSDNISKCSMIDNCFQHVCIPVNTEPYKCQEVVYAAWNSQVQVHAYTHYTELRYINHIHARVHTRTHIPTPTTHYTHPPTHKHTHLHWVIPLRPHTLQQWCHHCTVRSSSIVTSRTQWSTRPVTQHKLNLCTCSEWIHRLFRLRIQDQKTESREPLALVHYLFGSNPCWRAPSN